MASTILLKSRATSNDPPASNALKVGEMAVNTFDGRVYLGTDLSNGSGSAGGTATASTLVAAPVSTATSLGGGSASNSALATQLAIKTYVDSNAGTGDVTGVTAGDGLSGGGDSGALTLALDLNELGTETSIDQADFIAMVDATDDGSEKITFSNLEDTIFGNVSSGATIAAGGALTLANTSVTNAMLAGSIANAKLSNSTISGVALGSNLNALTVDDSSIELNSGTTYTGGAARTISVKDSGITNAMLAGSIAISKLAANDVTIAADSGTAHAIDLGETLTINGTSNEVNTAIANNTLTIGLPDDVTIAGNLTVSGSTTTVQNVAIGAADSIVFEGATADDYETTLTVTDPTDSDKTITLPNVTGTVITTGDTGTVATGMIADDAVTAAKLASNAVVSASIVDGTIVAGDLADDAVTAAKLASNAVVNASISSSAAIDMDKLDGGSLASTLSDLAQGDLLIAADVDASNALKSITFSDLEDAIFGNVSSGATIAAGGALTLASTSVTNAMLAGSIANAKLANSAITIAGSSTSLGGSISAATIAAAIDSETMTINNSTIDGGAYST